MKRLMEISINKPEDWSPSEVSEVISWQGHIPFAFSLMQRLQPNCFVELGTHKGDSYFAFCDAVRHFGLSTSCFAVDTWVGDEHAGLYSEEVFEKVQIRNSQQYSDFSKLIRSTFDEALIQFSDHSIDLLHIDGLHTYEAVRHDFETWVNKLSDKGIVLFHDTVVREVDFGVWKFWEEITLHYPSFEFQHSNGLGVLAVGSQVTSLFPDLFGQKNEEAEQMRITFSILGNSIAFSGAQKLIKKEREIAGAERSRLNEYLAQLETKVSSLNLQISERDRQIVALNQDIATRDQDIATRDQAIQAILQSHSWKITLPIREAKRWFTTPRQQFKKYRQMGLNLKNRFNL